MTTTVTTLVLIAMLAHSAPAKATMISEDQAVQQLTTQIQAEAAIQAPPLSAADKAAQDGANNTVCAKSAVDGHKVSWCIQPTDRTKNPFVIYFFHGLTLNEHRWQEAPFAADLQTAWKAKGMIPPTIVSISFGPVWLLTQTRDKKYDFFIQSLMPYFENIIGPVTAAQRIAMGESMGGFNVSQLLLKNPTLFSRFVLQCPAITEVGPFDPTKDVFAFIKRTGAEPKLAILTKIIGMYEFQNETEWLQHSPVQLSTVGTSFPTKVYMSCGSDDIFGFYEGTADVASILQKKTEALQYVFIQGGQHGTVDAPSMADFVSADWTATSAPVSAPTTP